MVGMIGLAIGMVSNSSAYPSWADQGYTCDPNQVKIFVNVAACKTHFESNKFLEDGGFPFLNLAHEWFRELMRKKLAQRFIPIIYTQRELQLIFFAPGEPLLSIEKSFGPDTDKGIRAYIVNNQDKFALFFSTQLTNLIKTTDLGLSKWDKEALSHFIFKHKDIALSLFFGTVEDPSGEIAPIWNKFLEGFVTYISKTPPKNKEHDFSVAEEKIEPWNVMRMNHAILFFINQLADFIGIESQSDVHPFHIEYAIASLGTDIKKMFQDSKKSTVSNLRPLAQACLYLMLLNNKVPNSK